MLTGMTSPLNQTIAAKVLALRTEAKVSRAALAEQSGIAERTLARRESGASAWNTDELRSIAYVLGCPVSVLLDPSTK